MNIRTQPFLPLLGSTIAFDPYREPGSLIDGDNCNLQYQAISMMPQYRDKSFEELRCNDYLAGRRTQGSKAAFWSTSDSQPLFTFTPPTTIPAQTFFPGRSEIKTVESMFAPNLQQPQTPSLLGNQPGAFGTAQGVGTGNNFNFGTPFSTPSSNAQIFTNPPASTPTTSIINNPSTFSSPQPNWNFNQSQPASQPLPFGSPQYSPVTPQQHTFGQYSQLLPGNGTLPIPNPNPNPFSPFTNNSAATPFMTGISHGRGPSIFSSSPQFTSPLYTWGVSPATGKSYAIGLNSNLSSDLTKPPGYMSLPSSRASSNGDSFLDRKIRSSPSSSTLESLYLDSLWENTSPAPTDWRSLIDNNIHRSRRKLFKSSFESNNSTGSPRPLPGNRPFNIDNDELRDGSEGVDIHYLHEVINRNPSRKFKILDPYLVRRLENSASRSIRTFDNPGPTLGLRYHGDSSSSRPNSARNSTLSSFSADRGSQQESPVPRVNVPPLIGLFEHPSEHPTVFSPPRRTGPPKDNSYIDGETEFQRMCNSLPKPPEPVVANLPKDFPKQYSNYAHRVRFIREEMPPTVSSLVKEASIRVDDNVQSIPFQVSKSSPKLSYQKQSSSHSPSGVTLHRPSYYCIPDIPTMDLHFSPCGHCFIDNFEVGHLEFGKVVFPGMVDVKGLNLDEIIIFKHKELELYPDGKKPPYGEGLNRRAVVTLTNVWPVDKNEGETITDTSRIVSMDYGQRLQASCKRFRGNFVSYDAEKGFWVFEIQLPS